MWHDLWKKWKDYRNVILVSALIGSMLIFMLGTVIYVTSQVANCSSAKKAKNMCMQTERKIDVGKKVIAGENDRPKAIG
ncbi:MAG: hypothetical protein L3J47_07615 [Sulfurovum sp.]|nr:hypothetical protein [Sulfurovum sp.]